MGQTSRLFYVILQRDSGIVGLTATYIYNNRQLEFQKFQAESDAAQKHTEF